MELDELAKEMRRGFGTVHEKQDATNAALASAELTNAVEHGRMQTSIGKIEGRLEGVKVKAPKAAKKPLMTTMKIGGVIAAVATAVVAIIQAISQ